MAWWDRLMSRRPGDNPRHVKANVEPLGEESATLRDAVARLRDATPQHYSREQWTRDTSMPAIERKLSKGEPLNEQEQSILAEELQRRREASE